MKRMLTAVAVLAFASPALAGPPDTAKLPASDARALLTEVVEANIAGENCTGFLVSDAEWNFLVTTADQLAAELGLSLEAYDEEVYGAAFEALDKDPNFCATEGPEIAEVIARLTAMGGIVDPFKLTG